MTDMRASFFAYNADGSPRVYIGMFRPPFEEWVTETAPYALGYHMPALRERWLHGAGDKPLYQRDEL